jgi:hypothetical protein
MVLPTLATKTKIIPVLVADSHVDHEDPFLVLCHQVGFGENHKDLKRVIVTLIYGLKFCSVAIFGILARKQ